ncbi:MAG TPA: lysophospholipid acyltransferase family protein, partial [bacterium]|nr:lysophospholipid acyltransferase family protein [bacterium]
PEGTRSPSGKLRRFKKGGFAFAQQTGLPVVPVTIIGSRQLTPKKASFILPGEVDVLVDKPIEVTGFGPQDRDHLVRRTREIIAKNKQEKAPVSV